MMIFENKRHYIIATNCVIVDGACRSLIYDLQRGDYEIITNELSSALSACTSNLFEDLFKLLPEEDGDFYVNILMHLINLDIIIPIEEEEKFLFPMISFDWSCPSKFSNAIIEYSRNSPFSLAEALAKIDKLGVSGIEIRLDDIYDIDFYRSIAGNLDSTGFKHVDFVVKYAQGQDEPFLYELKGLHPTIFLITQYNAPSDQVVGNVLGDYIGIQRTTRKYDDIISDRRIRPKNFIIGRNFFLESLNYNPYFNGKIVVHKDGEIYDNVCGEKLRVTIEGDAKAIEQNQELVRYWNARKDDTKVCCDCEFRYMCLDTRTPVMNETGWEHTTSCQYDPYTISWNNDEVPFI